MTLRIGGGRAAKSLVHEGIQLSGGQLEHRPGRGTQETAPPGEPAADVMDGERFSNSEGGGERARTRVIAGEWAVEDAEWVPRWFGRRGAGRQERFERRKVVRAGRGEAQNGGSVPERNHGLKCDEGDGCAGNGNARIAKATKAGDPLNLPGGEVETSGWLSKHAGLAIELC